MDNRFYNIGVGAKSLEPVLKNLIKHLKQEKTIDEFALTQQQISELGRFKHTQIIEDIGKFKTPTLRNISLTAPYMHDGRFWTLDDVLDHYQSGVQNNPTLDPQLKLSDTEFGISLTDDDKTKIIQFLHTLTDQDFLEDRRFAEF